MKVLPLPLNIRSTLYASSKNADGALWAAAPMEPLPRTWPRVSSRSPPSHSLQPRSARQSARARHAVKDHLRRRNYKSTPPSSVTSPQGASALPQAAIFVCSRPTAL